VWELLNDLTERIGARYEMPLVELIRADRLFDPAINPDQFDLFDAECVPNGRSFIIAARFRASLAPSGGTS